VERTRHLIVGAGVSGLAFADWLDDEYLIVEAQDEIGGYCRTVKRSGFVWDYAGHFFHFRHPEIERELVARMKGQRVLRVERQSRIWYGGRLIDFPFQHNIHQLPADEYAECVEGLRSRPQGEGESFKEMLYARYGRGIAEKFLIPYNEKLYATNLARLDAEAMGRFFPHASVEVILADAKSPPASSYNATFTYPEGGAVQYVEALAAGVRRDRISLQERLLSIDIRSKVATTTRREIRYDTLTSTAPLDRLLDICQIGHDGSIFSHNKVWVLNLGFDRKGPEWLHWIYFPQKELSFYRVGFYDNIFNTRRMSLYVEVGLPFDTNLSEDERGALKARVLSDLQACGVVTEQALIASHDVLLDPAYVHITRLANAESAAKRELLAAQDIYSIGRYGSWTYCSIEDNIVQARALAERLSAT
jgi:protoporphyrinogen oxidase